MGGDPICTGAEYWDVVYMEEKSCSFGVEERPLD